MMIRQSKSFCACEETCAFTRRQAIGNTNLPSAVPRPKAHDNHNEKREPYKDSDFSHPHAPSALIAEGACFISHLHSSVTVHDLGLALIDRSQAAAGFAARVQL